MAPRTAWGRLLLREGLQTFGPLCGPQEWWKCLTREFLRLGRIAQLVEQLTLNQRVLGSIPRRPTMNIIKNNLAKVAELVDALDLGSSGETRESSSLSFRTI